MDNAKFESDVAKSNSLFRSIGNTAEKEGSRIDNIFRKITVAATGFFTAQQALGYAQKIAQVRGEYQQLEVALNCCLIAKNLTEFWRNYNAFLHDLIKVVEIDEGEGVKVQTAERSLFVESTYEEYPCYYKSSKLSLFSPDDQVWCAFTLTLVFTAFRVGEDEYLLASEAGELIVTEDGEFYIDLKSYGY